jgi:5-formyltetrahydrofolate cyclo-ligase
MRQHAETAPPQVIALFGGLKNEPDFLPYLLPVLWDQGHRPCFFQIEASELQPRQVCSLDDLQRGQLNVWEPKAHCTPIEIAALDLILVPGLAFTRDGARLGRGGGYYDRLLANPACRAHRIGIAYELQIVDAIPVEPHDQRVHQIITESGLIQASASH